MINSYGPQRYFDTTKFILLQSEIEEEYKRLVLKQETPNTLFPGDGNYHQPLYMAIPDTIKASLTPDKSPKYEP